MMMRHTSDHGDQNTNVYLRNVYVETYFCSKMRQIQTHGQKALTSNYDSTYPSDIKK